MKRTILALVFLALVPVRISAAADTEVQVIDNRYSIHAEAISLGRLLHLLDSATGMKSTVAQEVVNRSISVQFSGLDFDAAIRKIFESQPLDYVVVPGSGISILGVSQEVSRLPVVVTPGSSLRSDPVPSTLQLARPFSADQNNDAETRQPENMNVAPVPPQQPLGPPGYTIMTPQGPMAVRAISPGAPNSNVQGGNLFGSVPAFGTTSSGSMPPPPLTGQQQTFPATNSGPSDNRP